MRSRALPLLSHALLETWKRRRGRTLTIGGYVDSGGAIARTADTVFDQRLTPEQQGKPTSATGRSRLFAFANHGYRRPIRCFGITE